MIEYYGVYRGFKPGVYRNWKDAEKQVANYRCADFKKFSTLEEAEYYYKNGENVPKINKNTKTKKIEESSIKGIPDIRNFFTVTTPAPPKASPNDVIIENLKQRAGCYKGVGGGVEDLNNIVIYTDGSCRNNGKPNASGGIGIHFPNEEFKDVSEKFIIGNITNQRTELYAILKAIDLVVNKPKYSKFKIIIYTDSQYSIKCITQWSKTWAKNNWQKKDNEQILNLDIIKPLYEYYNNHDITLIHVEAHTGKSKGNDIADSLATFASEY
jgi:ribonuclease HI